MHVFVTVGTTEFNELIQTVSSSTVCKLLKEHGRYSSITLQIGKGDFEPRDDSKYLNMDHFRSKPTIADDMKKADLIITHAGAGSVFESLSLGKKVIAVVNESLMDNHQRELAEALDREGNIIMTTYDKLEQLFSDRDFFTNRLNNLLPLSTPATDSFARLVDEEMGL
jgi:beta-1,4-N-acetylglucosaminyltransferase